MADIRMGLHILALTKDTHTHTFSIYYKFKNAYQNILVKFFFLLDNLTVHKMCHCHVLERRRRCVWTCLYGCVGATKYGSFTQLNDFEQCVYLFRLITELNDLQFVYFALCKAVVKVL